LNPEDATLAKAFAAAMTAACRHPEAGEARAAFTPLEHAHVLGQRRFGHHLRVHPWRLRPARALRDGREVRRELLRIVWIPIGQLSGRLPLAIPAAPTPARFRPMAIAPGLRRVLASDEPAVSL
jgi:hypothetical protein